MRSFVKDSWRGGALLTLCIGVSAGCSTLAGIDQDYREVAQPASDAGVGGGAGLGGAAGSGGGAGVGAAGASGAGGATGGTSGSGGSAGSTASCSSLGKQCVPAVPSGWSGPVAMASGPSTPPACTSEYPTQTTSGVLADNLSADPATCGCTCKNPVIAICSTATLNVYGGGTCGSTGNKVADLVNGSKCTAASLDSLATHMRATGNFISGSCVAQPSEQVPSATWGLQARACGGASTAGACSGGQLCVPPAATFEMCIYQAGNLACPAGYTNKSVFYEGFDDTRGCTACTCGTATGNCVGTGTVSLHNKNDCTDDVKTIDLGTCASAVTATHAKYNDGPATNVTCPPAPGAGMSTGTATPKDAVTFCCLS